MEKKDFQASHKDRIKTVISIPDESSEVTNRIIVGKKEENSKVLAECSDVRIVCQFSYTKAISPVSRSNWSVLIVTLIQLLHIIMLLSMQMPFLIKPSSWVTLEEPLLRLYSVHSSLFRL